MSKNILGVFYMLLSVTFFSLMDILVKVTDEYALGQILFFRSLFGFIPIFFLIPKKSLKNFYKTQRIGLHFYRSLHRGFVFAAIFSRVMMGKTVHHLILVGRGILLQWPIFIPFMCLLICFFCRKNGK